MIKKNICDVVYISGFESEYKNNSKFKTYVDNTLKEHADKNEYLVGFKNFDLDNVFFEFDSICIPLKNSRYSEFKVTTGMFCDGYNKLKEKA